MISYEASKWYIKVWRSRWYLYAVLLYMKYFLNPEIWLDFLLDLSKISSLFEDSYFDDRQKELKKEWKDIKHHIEISKMYKFSSKIEQNFNI